MKSSQPGAGIKQRTQERNIYGTWIGGEHYIDLHIKPQLNNSGNCGYRTECKNYKPY